ncbi:MAG: hypothetical protein LBC92_03280 [Rickettsiales bacterium]|jgi:hypothetical protein|nr:hypothetical protein [Rickettsiales bacterium]
MVDVSNIGDNKYKEIVGYLNKFVDAYSIRGAAQYKKGFFSPDAYKIGNLEIKIGRNDVTVGGKSISHSEMRLIAAALSKGYLFCPKGDKM